MIRKLVIPAVFLTGLLIFFYPIISNWLSTKDHYTVMSKHNEALQQMTEKEKAKEKEKAQKYNETLNETEIPIEDPFSEGATETAVTGYFNVLDIGETMGSLEIPSIQVKLPIYHGVSEDVLQQGIGHMSNSSFPIGGVGTHTALTGHRGLPSSKLFRDLDKVKLNEHFFIHTLDETLAYKVNDIQVVLPSETTWLQIDETKDYVTLITCEPYMINTHRLLVRGERVPYEEEISLNKSLDPMQKDQNRETWLLISSIVTILGIIAFYLIRKRQIRE
ncbi:class C sortase [Pseudogracilibacillus sp. SE30717A]|uniref:class C sortase n=1 Tax=Pseudogracilibacillus sp. SE30717A TaxID=3098293 RepID=UPI00300E47DD